MGELSPREGERAAVKITPGPAPARCGFLRFTALPGGKRRQELAWLGAGFDPFATSGEGAGRTLPPSSSLAGWGRILGKGVMVGSSS